MSDQATHRYGARAIGEYRAGRRLFDRYLVVIHEGRLDLVREAAWHLDVAWSLPAKSQGAGYIPWLVRVAASLDVYMQWLADSGYAEGEVVPTAAYGPLTLDPAYEAAWSDAK